MELKDFPFNTTSGLRDFSDLVSKAVKGVESSLNTTIEQKRPSLKGDDILEYWHSKLDNISYGRYLVFINALNLPIEFSTGLDITKSNVRFIVWFSLTSLRAAKVSEIQIDNLEKMVGNDNHTGKEVWIPIDDASFEDFCKTRNTSTLSDFIEKALLNVK